MRRKEDANLIVPFGYAEAQPERETLLHFVVEECVRKQSYPNVRVVLVESSARPTQASYAKQYCDEYVFLPRDQGLYSAAIVQNEGFMRATTAEYTYIHQADFLLPPEMVEMTIERMKELEAPVIFPYYSSVNFSKPLTEALTGHRVDWKAVLAAMVTINTDIRKETHKIGMVDRRYLSPAEIKPLILALPEDLHIEDLAQLDPTEIWGVDDGNFTYFGDSFKVVQPSEYLVKYRPGGRAKASYLARSVDYDKSGGSPNYAGWGYEDLGFWARVQALYDYKRTKDGDMYFNGHSVSTDYPIIHLWHSTTGSADYFAMMDGNKRRYESFIALSRDEQRAAIKPLGKYG